LRISSVFEKRGPFLANRAIHVRRDKCFLSVFCVFFFMDSDVFAGFSMLFIHAIYFFLSFFNSLTTVSALAPNPRAVARILAPPAARLIMAFFTKGLQPL
jgi:hypothetical protein